MGLTPQQRVDAIRRANDVHRFPRLVPIVGMDGRVAPIEPTRMQDVTLRFMEENPWTIVDKYRQARMSTIHATDLLRVVGYTPRSMGMLIGNVEKTYKEQMRRLGDMWRELPEAIQPPLEQSPSSESVLFKHRGLIQGLTGGGSNPAVSFSPDYAWITEYFLFEVFEAFHSAFFPAIERRAHARLRIEGTPGAPGTLGHKTWLNAVAGKGRFKALFLPWWKDESCALPCPRDFEPTPEEKEYRRKIASYERQWRGKPWWPFDDEDGISDGHLFFRRVTIETTYDGDPRLFDRAYPPSPFEGWLASERPMIPQDALAELMADAVPVEFGEEKEFERHDPECPYVVLADGAGFGREGDPSSLLLVNLWDQSEAGCWEGREDPDRFAARIVRWQKKWNAVVIVEANRDGVAAALATQNCPKLWWSKDGHPGWMASTTSKDQALTDFVSMLRAREVVIRSLPTLEQLSTWDGTSRRHAQTAGRTHHYDRATCWLLFAFAVRTIGGKRRPGTHTRRTEKDREVGLTADEFCAMFAKKEDGQHVLGRVR